jgi:hypothetical protein
MHRVYFNITWILQIVKFERNHMCVIYRACYKLSVPCDACMPHLIVIFDFDCIMQAIAETISWASQIERRETLL